MKFCDQLTNQREVNELLEKIERCRESCRTDEGMEQLDNLEYVVANRLDVVRANELEYEEENRLDLVQKILD